MYPIRNIIFDFGGVLLDLAPERCRAAFHAIGFHAIDSLLNLTHQQGILDEMERGENTIAGFCAAVREAIASAPDPSGKNRGNVAVPSDETILNAWRTMADGIPAYRLDEVARLASEGYHVSALSNTNVVHWAWCRPMFLAAGHAPEQLFEHVWLSCEMHLVKPDPAVFAHILADSCYAPAETLFVDDSATNCAAAAQFGIRTFQPPVRSDWRMDLRHCLAQYA